MVRTKTARARKRSALLPFSALLAGTAVHTGFDVHDHVSDAYPGDIASLSLLTVIGLTLAVFRYRDAAADKRVRTSP